MFSLEDCIGLCGLTEEEVRAIAEHERIPEIAAAELGSYLVLGSARCAPWRSESAQGDDREVRLAQ